MPSDKKNKQYETEWHFNFEDLGRQIRDIVSGIREHVESEQADETDDASDDAQTGTSPVKQMTLAEPVGTAMQATLRIEPAVAELEILPLIGSEMLFEAEIEYTGEVIYEVTGESQKVITLREEKRSARAFLNTPLRKPVRWVLRVNPNIPVTLEIKGGVGRSLLTLTDLKAGYLVYSGSVGEAIIKLPYGDAHTARINAGVGAVTIDVPDTTTAAMTLRSGIGKTTVVVPHQAALTVTGSIGVGDISVPDFAEPVQERRAFTAKKGVWTTPDFGMAANPITINFEGGVGALEITAREAAEV
ncbi:MAG: hypothetical protein ACOCYT_00175 [Chloroflexota bacterium]